MNDNDVKADIKRRLNRIEGQVRGIQRMVDNDQCCSDILVQISAVRAAINKVGGMILDNYTKTCIKSAIESGNAEENLEELVETIIRFTK